LKKKEPIEKTLEDSFTNALPDTTPEDKNPKGIVVATPSELNPRLAKEIEASNIPKLQGETLEEDEIITPEGEVYNITHGISTKSERTAGFRKALTAIAYGEEREVIIDGKKQKITPRRTDLFPGDLTPFAQYCENTECKEVLNIETIYDGTDIIVIKTCDRCNAKNISVSDMRKTRFFTVSRK
jgi:hypothetical protein